MPEHPAEPSRPGPERPAAPRRVIPEWEYRTAYMETFQIRMPSGMQERLDGWARQEGKSLEGLVIELLEEAVRRRDAGDGELAC